MKTKLATKPQHPKIKRDLKILKLICEEYTTAEIGKKLGISIKTVDNVRDKLMIKTKSKNVVGLLKYAIKNKIYRLK